MSAAHGIVQDAIAEARGLVDCQLADMAKALQANDAALRLRHRAGFWSAAIFFGLVNAALAFGVATYLIGGGAL